MVLDVHSDFHPAVRPLDKGRPFERPVLARELSELPLVDRRRLDESLQANFLALDEGPDLEDPLLQVDKDAQSMGQEHLLVLEVLAPEVEALVVADRHLVVFDVLGDLYQVVVQELLEVERDLLVLLRAVLDVLVDRPDVVFKLRER